MHRTQDFIALIVQKTPAKTKYAAAKLLGVPNQSLNDWTNRGRVMGDAIGIKTAEILGFNPCYVVACLAAERASPEVLESCWRDILETIPTTRTPYDIRKSIAFLEYKAESLRRTAPAPGHAQNDSQEKHISR